MSRNFLPDTPPPPDEPDGVEPPPPAHAATSSSLATAAVAPRADLRLRTLSSLPRFSDYRRSRLRRRSWSNQTAAISTRPTATSCQYGCTPVMTKPFLSTAGIHTPISVPMIEPIPPNRLVPPSATAVIAWRLSVECPPMLVVEKYATDRNPANPAVTPPMM